MAQDPKKTTPSSPAPKNQAAAAARSTSKPSTKPAPVAPPAPPEVPSGQLMLKVKDLVDRVAEATDGKRGQIKDIVEATLAVLGRALDAGETLNLPPIGKIRVSKAVSEGTKGAMTVKVRKGNPPKEKAPKPPKEPKVKEKTAGKGNGKGGGNAKAGGKAKEALAEAED